MAEVFNASDVTVILPVGGRATRALAVTADTIPKHLITLGNGLAVLEVVCRQLQLVGFRRFVFCTGHHQEQIANFVRERSWVSHENVYYEISVESEPLGPEGAILAAIGLNLPLVAAPALNNAQAAHPAFNRSVAALREMGVTVLYGPGVYEPGPPGTGGRPYDWELPLEALDEKVAQRGQG